jgi:endoplasmic reticulum Man9GlcNAc2 1,2-alpha-mannosidase
LTRGGGFSHSLRRTLDSLFRAIPSPPVLRTPSARGMRSAGVVCLALACLRTVAGQALPPRDVYCVGFRILSSCSEGLWYFNKALVPCSVPLEADWKGACVCRSGSLVESLPLECGHQNVTCLQACRGLLRTCATDQSGSTRCEDATRIASSAAPTAIATPTLTAPPPAASPEPDKPPSQEPSVQRQAPSPAQALPPQAHGRAEPPEGVDFALWVNQVHLPGIEDFIRSERLRDNERLRAMGIDLPLRIPDDPKSLVRQEAVRRAIQHAWAGYTRYARGFDDLLPLSRKGGEGLCKMGLTAVDSLDTLLIAQLAREYADAKSWVDTSLEFGLPSQEDINVFETVIRIVGGLLSVFDIAGDVSMLSKAASLMTMLVDIAFETPTGIPFGTVGLYTRKAFNPSWVAGASSIAEVLTLQLEMVYLARKAQLPDLEKRALNIVQRVEQLKVADELYPIYLSPANGQFLAAPVTLGARGDSAYEYLLKQYLQFRSPSERKGREWIKGMYERSVRGILDRLLQHGHESGAAFLAEQVKPQGALPADQSPRLSLKMDHLVCFAPGMFALGAVNRVGFSTGWLGPTGVVEEGFFRGVRGWHGANGAQAKLLNVSGAILDTCHRMYASTRTGLAPEIVTFFTTGEEMRPNSDALHSLLRPETVESLFVMWRITHDERYRDWAWDIFIALERHARVWSGGYSSVKNVNFVAEEGGEDVPLDEAMRIVEEKNREFREECETAEKLPEGRCSWARRSDPSLFSPPDRVPVNLPDEGGARDVQNLKDHMESFFLAETLKYLYLMWSDDREFALEDYIFTTEAHPLSLL